MNNYEQGADLIARVRQEIAKEIIGQQNVVDSVVMALMTGGNILLEGMPGLGKTRLVQTISNVMSMSFKRIQFTPDLMPADITGTNIMVRDETGSAFKFEPGPVFANIVLADEINRATPKTQSALLEAMQEHTVTVGDTSYMLPAPFFVLATQNPIEQEGTYPLPEAQLDRFSMKVLVEFPTREELKGIVGLTEGVAAGKAERIMDAAMLTEIQRMVQEMPIADAVMDRILDIVMATHQPNKYIREGVSPRAAQNMIRCSRARAFMNGVEAVAYPVLRHRIITSFDAVADGVSEDSIIRDILRNLA